MCFIIVHFILFTLVGEYTLVQFNTFLRDYIRKEEENIKKEMEKVNEEELVKKAKKIFENKTVNVMRYSPSSSNYKLVKITSDQADYKLLEGSLRSNSDRSKHVGINLINRANTVRMYRVVSKQPVDPTYCQEVLLLHGTKGSNVEEILKTGFQPSKEGMFGPGVYLTDSIQVASVHGQCFAQDKNVVKSFNYYFVVKIKTSDVREVSAMEFGREISFQEYLQNKPAVKVFEYYQSKPMNFESSRTDKFDSENNRVLQGTFHRELDSVENIALAHHSSVVPVYLIEVEEKTSVKEMVSDVLYNKLRVSETYNKIEGNSDSKKSDECTLEAIMETLKAELAANQRAKLERYNSKLDKDVESIMKQLAFRLDSIWEARNSSKYKAELLTVDNDDYKFIESFIGDSPKILQLFKINPHDRNDMEILKDGNFLLNGVKSYQVASIIADGYLEDDEFTAKSSSNELQEELRRGTSYCEVENEVKKLSFVFVDLGRYENLKKTKNKDSSLTHESLFGGGEVARIPAYLIVFELK